LISWRASVFCAGPVDALPRFYCISLLQTGLDLVDGDRLALALHFYWTLHMGLDLVLDQVVGVLADQHRIVFGDEFFGDDYDLSGTKGLVR
jgi:hypothetical protein